MKNFGDDQAPVPPSTLSEAAATLWRQLQTEYQISDKGGLIILTAACESYDRMREASIIVEREGMTIKDRFGQDKVHPAFIAERDSRAAMLQALKMLNLDLEPLKAVGRPPSSVYFRG